MFLGHVRHTAADRPAHVHARSCAADVRDTQKPGDHAADDTAADDTAAYDVAGPAE